MAYLWRPIFIANTMKKIFLAPCALLLLTVLSCKNNAGNEDRPSTPHEDSTTISPDSSDSAKGSTLLEDSAVTIDTTKQYVFLTFDDGPQPGTMEVAHTIEDNGVNASFFMVGVHAKGSRLQEQYLDSIKSNPGIWLLVNHSYTHAFNDRYMLFYHHPQDAAADFFQAETSLGATHKIVRFPGNNAWFLNGRERSSALVRGVGRILDSAGYKAMGWDVEWHFKRNPAGHGSVPVQSATGMAHGLITAMEKHESYTKNCVVLLAHDRMFHLPQYADSLSTMIQVVKREHPEYIFATIDKYPVRLRAEKLLLTKNN